MKVSIKRVGPGARPAFKVDGELLIDCGAAANASIIRNIVKQVRADGSALKRNAPSTLRAKREAGLGARSLVATDHRFVQSNAWGRLGWDGKVLRIGALNAELARLVRYVMDKGYVGWLGIDRIGHAAIRAAVRKWIKREFMRWRGGR